MSGLRDVLADHDWLTPRGYAWPCCTCGEEFPDGEEAAYDHVGAAVLDWLGARLDGEDVLEAVCESIALVSGEMDQGETEAAIQAVREALIGKGATQ